eukprot:PITA_14281
MYNDESVANYFVRVDEIVNCIKNLGEEVKEAVVVEKVLRSLSPRFESKVSAIEEKEKLQDLKLSQLHGILIAYEMRKGGPSDRREAAFKASGKGNYYESGHITKEEEESNFVKNIQQGTGRFRDDDYMDAIDVDGFYDEITRLKRCLDESNVIIDSLQSQLDEKEKSFEKLECEIVGIRKEIEKTKALNLKHVKGSETLDEIINVQRSPLIKTGLGYNGEASQASTSKSYLDSARRSEKRPNRNHQVNQGLSSSRTNKDYQENRGQATLRTNRSYNQPQVKSSQFSSRMDVGRNYNRLDDSRRNFFNGQCFSCHNFGHKAAQCVSYKTIMTREAQKQISMPTIMKRTYNNFSALESEIECSICNNFGHEDSECRSRFWNTSQKEQTSSAKTWRMKEPHPKRCGIAIYAEGQENQWYIDSGCSKHMIGDKEKLESYTALEKEKKFSFGNDTPATIKGKGIAQLKEDVKAGNVLYVDGLKHNLLSVSQMSDNGTEVIFRSDGCSVHDLDIGRTVIKGKRTPNNLYIFEEGEQQCYLSKNDEHWLWHRRLGHQSFSQIRKACKYQAVRGLPDIKIPDKTICKSCQFGKQTRINFPEKEGSANRPLELVRTDVCGPFRTRSPRGKEYLILFIDDYSRMVWLGLMKHKDEAFEKFKSFKALVENESDYKIKCLRSDRGGEFTSNEFFDFCEDHGIRMEFSTARTPQQNGVVEK